MPYKDRVVSHDFEAEKVSDDLKEFCAFKVSTDRTSNAGNHGSSEYSQTANPKIFAFSSLLRCCLCCVSIRSTPFSMSLRTGFRHCAGNRDEFNLIMHGPPKLINIHLEFHISSSNNRSRCPPNILQSCANATMQATPSPWTSTIQSPRCPQ